MYLILDLCNLLHGRHGEMKPLGRPTGVCLLLPTHAALQGVRCTQTDEGNMHLRRTIGLYNDVICYQAHHDMLNVCGVMFSASTCWQLKDDSVNAERFMAFC